MHLLEHPQAIGPTGASCSAMNALLLNAATVNSWLLLGIFENLLTFAEYCSPKVDNPNADSTPTLTLPLPLSLLMSQGVLTLTNCTFTLVGQNSKTKDCRLSSCDARRSIHDGS